MSVEAETEEEAKEIVRDTLFSDPFNDSDIEGDSSTEILEVYEWDKKAQCRFENEVNERFSKTSETCVNLEGEAEGE
jgi:hypothetical protein